MVRTKAKRIDLTGQARRELAEEVEQLRAALAVERAERIELEGLLQGLRAERNASPQRPAVAADAALDRQYVFAGDDADRVAFDEFFTQPDPHLDRIRKFLLD